MVGCGEEVSTGDKRDNGDEIGSKESLGGGVCLRGQSLACSME